MLIGSWRCFSLICEKHRTLGWEEGQYRVSLCVYGKIHNSNPCNTGRIWGFLVLAVIWFIWLETNQGMFDDKVGAVRGFFRQS